jgi:hypothetical protein
MDASKVKAQAPVQTSKPPVQQSRSASVQARPPEVKQVQEQKPRPTVNSQGQTIGRRLNVTA